MGNWNKADEKDMKEFWEKHKESPDGNIHLYLGDSLKVVRNLEANSIDSIVCDPPYGINFMNKNWDHGIPGVPFWKAFLRVAKPGAYLLAFGGTRTFHRLAVAIEDAGWEIRDCVMWVYGQGFPKSLDVSKAIDKDVGVEREIIGRYVSPENTTGMNSKDDSFGFGLGDMSKRVITAPATESEKLWQGWGTGLKPAWEPIIMARKPLEGTVIENVQKYGTGAINIDGCRIDALGDNLGGGMVSMGRPKVSDGWDRPWMHDKKITDRKKIESASKVELAEKLGRWPANLILSYSEDEYMLRDDVTSEQLRQLAKWLDENSKL